MVHPPRPGAQCRHHTPEGLSSSSTCASLQHSEQSPQMRPPASFGAWVSSLMATVDLAHDAWRRHGAIVPPAPWNAHERTGSWKSERNSRQVEGLRQSSVCALAFISSRMRRILIGLVGVRRSAASLPTLRQARGGEPQKRQLPKKEEIMSARLIFAIVALAAVMMIGPRSAQAAPYWPW